MIKYEVRKNAYYDSVTLMLISKEIKEMDGVVEVLVGMGTDLNKELAGNLGLGGETLDALSANDFFIATHLLEETVMNEVTETVDRLLNQKKQSQGSAYRPASLETALGMLPDANMALVSIAGQYAEEEVMCLLEKDLHVMLFSDNVSLDSELRLKKLAVQKGLLMMGPDCGTAIINGIPLAFANVVKRGGIGIIGASGTGTQEVSVIIDKLGEGVSQVIGTGGRDLKTEIGGLMMIQAMDALMRDPATKVLVLISKPPAKEVAEKILKKVSQTPKPVVVDFIGGDAETIALAGAYPCISLEDAAHKAVALLRGETVSDFDGFSVSESWIEAFVEESVEGLMPEQRHLKGLFTGGTLADEAMKLLGDSIGDIYSNIPLSPELGLEHLREKAAHVCLDLGEDQFTVGRPHPMIDPSTRSEKFETEVDENTAVVLMDVVLGYGSHQDPAKAVAEAVTKTNARLKHPPVYIASITGTLGDPQNLEASQKTLEAVGIRVMPSNAQAVRLVKILMARVLQKGDKQ